MNYTIRQLQENEYGMLENFLYEAIFVPEGAEPPLPKIIYQPQLQVYISGFGKNEGDTGFAAEISGKIVGAAWGRIMYDYGHVDNDTPSIAISLFKEYRGLGIGTALMHRLLAALKSKGYVQVSLSVQKANYAVNMYKNVGFAIADENDEEYIMICWL